MYMSYCYKSLPSLIIFYQTKLQISRNIFEHIQMCFGDVLVGTLVIRRNKVVKMLSFCLSVC